MKSDKFLILIGDWPKHIIEDLRLFDLIEDKLSTEIIKLDEFSYKTIIDDKEIIIQFCFGSEENEFRKIREEHWKEKLPPSIESISNRDSKFKEVYYVGFCGLINGKVNEIYLPNQFKKVNFKDYWITPRTKFKISRKIERNNILSSKMKGKICTGLTSNQVLLLKYMKDRNPETLRLLGEKLSEQADIIEMEGYGVMKYFSGNCPIGLAYLGTDSPIRKEYILGQEMAKVNWDKFKRMTLNLLKKL
ncbi:MAG: hypothetical protein Q7S27_06895 [Nanoarchaeota archaeon]|nr:hypothetical protein [Nanoarchaeota archaeon]